MAIGRIIGGACGQSFKEFLSKQNLHYVAGKFGCDRDVDFDGTIEKWKKDVLFYRRSDDLTKEQARDMWEEIERIEGERPDLSGMQCMVVNSSELMSFYDHMPPIETMVNYGFQFFWYKIWPLLLKEFEKELTNQPQTAPRE